MSRIKKSFIALMGLLVVMTSYSSTSLPKGSILLEAEEYFMKDARFEIADCIHTSATRFVGAKKVATAANDECFLFQGDFPDAEYTIWACVRNLKLELRSSVLDAKQFNGGGEEWHWISLGRYNRQQIGSTFSVYGVPDGGKFAEKAGLDTILLIPDANFVPKGVFQGYSGPENTATEPAANSAIQVIEYRIDNTKPGDKISPFIASANAHGTDRHTPDNAEWDEVMFRFYGGNMLAPLIGAKRNAAPEDAWNFTAIDKFLERAKERWQVKEIMMFPQWWIEIKNGESPSQKQLDDGVETLMQLVRRYGDKKSPLYVRYWVLSDEWPCGGYWKKNYREFAAYYARLVREVKKFNPELIVGGPVDCWPNDTITAELLKTCPELDFIAWNMFISGRADTPLPALFQRTSFIKTSLRSSRELGRRYLKKDIPVFITSLGPNYHAWDPLDLRLAEPAMGVWHALAINYMAEENCAAGMFYNVRALDCGFFGPSDGSAVKTGMQPDDIDSRTVNLRPAGHIVEFYKQHLSGKNKLGCSTANQLKDFNLIAAAADNGETMISAVNFAETPRLLKLKFAEFKAIAYDSRKLPSKFIYCDQTTLQRGEGFFFRADGTAELWMPPFSTWNILVVNRENAAEKAVRQEKANRYQDLAAVFHFDGNLDDAAGSGSKTLGWYGEHFTDTHFKCGTGAGNYVGNLHNRARIKLAGRAAALNGSKTLGIAFWVYRVKNTADYGSILSFGKGKFMIEHVGGGNPDPRFQLKSPGFCNFGGTWNHSLMIPANEWAHVAITADGVNGRIIVNGQTKWTFPQTDNGLNGSDTLYLGSQAGDDGPIDCYIDELILSDRATGEEWARDIYNRTKDGQNY